MRAVVQRVSQAQVTVAGELVGQIGKGFLVLLGVSQEDTQSDVIWLAEKLALLRVFEDDAGKMNLSVMDVSGAVLLVSQFTLLGDCRKGRRPSFTAAARPELAQQLYLGVRSELMARGIVVETGRFQAEMQVTLTNDGPVTLLLDSQKQF